MTMMPTRFAAGILAAMLIACGRSKPPVPDPLAAAEQTLRPFLDKAIYELVHESGSTEKRWEFPFVTQEMLLLSDMEFYRERAFIEGLSVDRTEIPLLKAPTPRSFWLPISSEGTYTYSVTQQNRQDDAILITVQFHSTVETTDGPKTNSDQIAIYHMAFERGTWRVAEITAGKDFTGAEWSLKRYLTRKEYMSNS